MSDPALKDHKLEEVEDLESWIIIHLKLMSIKLIWPCRNAGKQGAWHGNTSLREPLWGFFQSVSQEILITFSTHKLPFNILVQKLSVTCVNQKWYRLCNTNVLWGLKSQTSYMELISLTLAQFILPPPIHIFIPLNILNCRSTADQKSALEG